jgi:hypothetical protein
MSKTVIVIHGAWLTPAAREPFCSRYQAKGYPTVAPPWPLEDRPIEELRRVQRQAPSATAFKSFPGRSHFLLAEPGWEEVADYAIQWASEHARPTAGGGKRTGSSPAGAARS